MTDSNDLLVPSEGGIPVLDNAISNLFNAHNVTVGCAQTLIIQTPFTNNLLTTLPEDQALAAEHAMTFKSGWGYGVSETFIMGLTSISEFVLALSTNGLSSTAEQLDTMPTTDPSYKDWVERWRAQLSAMVDACCNVDADSGSTLLRMKNIHDQLQELATQIDDDDVRLTTAIKEVKNQDTINKLKEQQASLQKQLAEVNNQIAKGASTEIASSIAFGVEFGSEFIDGFGAGAVAGAALSIYGEANEINEFNEKNKQYSEQQDSLGQQISDLVTTIGEDEVDMATLTLSSAQVDIFNTQITGMVSTTGGIIDQMLDWKKQLNLLAEHSEPPSPNYFSDQVSTGITYWTSLKAALTRYSAIMALSKTSSSLPSKSTTS
ncbi:MAG: hypothetical protein ETSY1_15315 [Candidatus Entotheonella factor]|uniref:Uncharacterized protein n=1 Tax=Entotheonella factor TaxID=1429438 RepID=W4LNA2_ENTF1|nr:hypothetical protein [Candidatus Entotheonella palauensis]ETW99354.1 MAG: hypothetical protein ETSY1_15315 [Candidatus Entotheonella factor]